MDLKEINILGFGTMGRQVAALFFAFGFSVNVWVRKRDSEKEKKFLLDLKLVKRTLQLESSANGEIKFFEELGSLPYAITVEALIEDLNVKKEVIQKLTSTGTEYLIFTNSSSIPATELGEEICAMHFFNPIGAVKLIELYVPDEKMPKILQFLSQLIDAGYEVVPVMPNIGMIGNFMLFTYISEYLFLIENKNYLPEQILSVMSKINFGINPLDVINIVGVDVVHDIICNLKLDRPNIYLPKSLSDAIQAGVLGRKNKTCFSKFINDRIKQ
jgi:3-hydroxybutyryl-CoA dehydrogenase